MRIRRSLPTMSHDEAERRLRALREDQSRRDAARHRLRRHERIRENVIAAFEGTLFVGFLVAMAVLAAWVAVSEVLPGFQVRWK